MLDKVIEPARQLELRSKANARLTRRDGSKPFLSASAALEVLYELASSPASAPDALALLHELQVYQVELELQDEELHRTRAELEINFNRQLQLYDFAPVGYFTVDCHTTLYELNLTGARQLGIDRAAGRGRSFDAFLVPKSASALHTMLARFGQGSASEAGALQLLTDEGTPKVVLATIGADPGGDRFLIVCAGTGEHQQMHLTSLF